MKYFVILFTLMFLTMVIPTSLAQQVPDCTFGSTMTPLPDKFAKDLAVKEFLKQHPNSTKTISADDSENPKNQFVLYAEHDSVKETLELHFNTDEKGCYIPVEYHYKYSDGTIDVTVVNTIGNFTEIVNLIKSDNITMDNFYPNNCDFVNLKHSISAGNVYGICEKENSVFALLDASSDAIFEVDIPIDMVYSLPSTDCIPSGDFIVMDNRESPIYNIVESDIGNSVSVELEEGFHRIQISGTIILPSPSPAQYCGVVEGFAKPYLPPRNQIDNGMKPTSVKCNEGLILLQKYDGSPACVELQSISKLIKRGWTDTKYDKNEMTQMFQNSPEAREFYAVYDGAEKSVREDHVSYFAGSEDGYMARMNMFFDENHALDHIDFHCYFQNTHRFELAQEDIPFQLARHDCKETTKEHETQDANILKYSPVLFRGTGVDLQNDDLLEHLNNKRDQLEIAFDDVGAKGLHPMTGMSFSMGNNAYSLDEQYVGNPVALEIGVLEEKFTAKTLEEMDQLVRKYVGDEIDIVYSKGNYITPTPLGVEDKKQEHYEIEILGLKDKYAVGDEFSFYFIISGYGYGCANYDVRYPDENGNTISMGVEVLCAAEQHMAEFEINHLERKGTIGNYHIQKSGTYTVTVTFEMPNQYFPTSVSKTFEVIE
ncbi:MAG: hypothetical protein K5793_00040 [Nitrosarchaeum sp.]|nr:hypothetical protein [Nitrosarchaeum sp.]